MTITREIPSEQMRGLDLHEGDSLRVVAETGSTFLIQIVKAAEPAQQGTSKGAGAWARKYAGVAKTADSREAQRLVHYQDKYGI